jgi:hypothetical protein
VGRKSRPKLTITCKCCNQDFCVFYRERHRIYCGRSCQAKSVTKTDIRKTSICIICKKNFKHYGERILCSRTCNAKYMSQTRIGENNPAYTQKKEKIACLGCGRKFEYSRIGMHKGTSRVFCSLDCAHTIDLRGQPKTGIINPYPTSWRKVKPIIRKRDSYRCQLCGLKETSRTHHVHHINYDKNDLDNDNLITLCQKCHNMTHNARTFWEIIFSGIISGSKIVKKGWGIEIHIVNHNDYCLKYLIFFKNKRFSYHSHCLKKELWHCVYGKFQCLLSKGHSDDYILFNQGNKIEIERNTVHQLLALKNSILVEVSTRDYKEDSYRVLKGD